MQKKRDMRIACLVHLDQSEGDELAIRSICYLALTFDHRLVDGAMAYQFTGRVKQILENWSEEVF